MSTKASSDLGSLTKEDNTPDYSEDFHAESFSRLDNISRPMLK